MRKALNDNPLVQIGILAVLALLVGFLLITRMSHKSPESSTTPTAESSAAGSVVPATSSDSTATTPSSTSPGSTAPDTAAATPAPATPSGTTAAGASAGDFVAGPGLPAPVVNAYKANRVVVLLVVRRNGIDDDAVRRSVEDMAGQENVALFVTNAGHIARYSRIATGVDLDRVPALIVLQPRELTDGTPTAMVSYGYRGPESVAQAIDDATYKGPTDLPYYPK